MRLILETWRYHQRHSVAFKKYHALNPWHVFGDYTSKLRPHFQEASELTRCGRVTHMDRWTVSTLVQIEIIKTTSMGNVSTGVLDQNKEHYLRRKNKAEKIIWCIKTYIVAYVKIQKQWRFIIHYAKPTAQRLFKSRFLKSGPTYRRQVVSPRYKMPQRQLVPKPETHLHNILVK